MRPVQLVGLAASLCGIGGVFAARPRTPLWVIGLLVVVTVVGLGVFLLARLPYASSVPRRRPRKGVRVVRVRTTVAEDLSSSRQPVSQDQLGVFPEDFAAAPQYWRPHTNNDYLFTVLFVGGLVGIAAGIEYLSEPVVPLLLLFWIVVFVLAQRFGLRVPEFVRNYFRVNRSE